MANGCGARAKETKPNCRFHMMAGKRHRSRERPYRAYVAPQ
jgi:hypothetical protein